VKIPILYEDFDLIVVEKPAGILAVPTVRHAEFSSASPEIPKQVRDDRLKPEKTIGDMVGAMPVHRLDRDTSGIMILAKNEKAKEAMQKLFSERKIKKTYTALVWGKVEPKKGEIQIPLGRGAKDRLRVVPRSDGRESKTIYDVIKYFRQKRDGKTRPRKMVTEKSNNEEMSLMRIDLKTGRTHQIRVHFSAIGHPVVGDQKYSNRKTELKRQFLHASEISFIHPFTGEEIHFKSELPKDLDKYLNSLS